MKKVVIIGGGFAGLTTAHNLVSKFKIVLINSTNYFLFTPLLHEVAVGSVNRFIVVHPIREVIRHKNFQFLRTSATKIDTKKKVVYYEQGKVEYNYLIVAIGAKTNYYNIKGAEENTLCLKTVGDSTKIRNQILESLEKASLLPNSQRNLTYVVIGAGPTGVELTGDISDFLEENMRNYPSLKNYKLYLIQAATEILPVLSERSRKSAVEKLKNKGVTILTSTPVIEVKKHLVIMNHQKIPASTIIWSGGIKPNYIQTVPKLQNDKGYFPVDSFLRVEDNIFALGDCAFNSEKPVPALAQVAVKQAEIASENIVNLDQGKELREFKFKKKGILVSVGRKYAVADISLFNRTINLKGLLPWFIKRHTYLMNLIGLQNKVQVGIEWFLNLIFPRDTSEI